MRLASSTMISTGYLFPSITAAVIEMKNLTKSFPGVKALDNVNFTVYRNEIVGLVGEN